MKPLRTLSRFHLLFILLSLVAAVLILYGLGNRSRSRHIERTLSQRTLPLVRFQTNALQMQRWLANIAAGGDQAYIAEALSKAAEHEEAGRRILKDRIFDHSFPVDIHNRLVELQRDLTACYALGRRMAESYLKGNRSLAQSQALVFNIKADGFTDYINLLVDREVDHLNQLLAAVHHRTEVIILLSGALIVAFISLGFLSRRITRRYTEQLMEEIEERKRAERAARLRAAQFRTIFETSPYGIAITRRRDDTFLRVNPAFLKITGYPESEIIGRSGRGIGMSSGTPAEFPGGPVGEGGPDNVRKTLQSPGGRTLHILVSAAPIDYEGEACLLSMVVDITEAKQMEDQLRHAQKMDVVGQLAGGIAHDFNNMLSGIMGCAQVMSLKADKDSPLRQYVTTILDTARRAGELTGKLLTFSRKRKTFSTLVDVHRPILDAVSLMEHCMGNGITIEKRFEARRRVVVGDAVMLQNAVLNLAVNARDAMPRGGTLTVATSDVEAGAGFFPDAPDPLPAGPYVRVDVGDTGTGMDHEVRERIFEPYYTTKEPGKGTGLGLPSVFGTVRQHRGAVRVESRPGEGSVFTIFLPVAASNDGEALGG